jgi:hypothetical protein
MTTPFTYIVEDFLRCLDYGFAVGNPVWMLGEWAPKTAGANRKRYTMLKKIGPRPAPSIKEFLYDDNGGPAGAIQFALKADGKVEETPIDIKDLMIVTFNRRGGNFEGKSVLRTAYPHWIYKTRLYKIDAIQKERHGIGVPKIKLQPGYSQADKIAAHELGRNIRTNEWAHMVLPPGLEVEFAELHGNAVDVIPSIEHHNAMIMLNVLLEFLLAGIDAGGGRATSTTQIDMFLKASLSTAELITECFNQFLIPKLVGYNFKVTRLPQLKARNVGQTKDLQQFAAAMKNLTAGDNPVITMDDETENWVRTNTDMPIRHVPRPPRIVKQSGGTGPATDPTSNGNTNEKQGAKSGKTLSGSNGAS